MQFLRLIFVKKLQLQGASPPDPDRGRYPLAPQKAPTFQLTFPFLIPMPATAVTTDTTTTTISPIAAAAAGVALLRE